MAFSRMPLLLVCALLLPALVRGQSGDFLGKNADEWAKQLKDPEPNKRRSAAFALGQIGNQAQEYLPLLLEVASADKTPGVRERAAMAIGSIVLYLKDDAKIRWPILGPGLEQRLVRETDVRVRRGLLYAVGAFGPTAAPTVPRVLAALDDKNPAIRQNAAWALGKIGPAVGKEGVAELCKRLKDDSPVVRRDVANAIGDIGQPTAMDAVEPLLDLIDREGKQEGDPVVLKAALEKMVNLAGEPAYFVTDKTLAALRTQGIPEQFMAKFTVLKGKEFTRDTLLTVLLKDVDRPEAEQLRDFMIENAGRYGNQRWAARLEPYLKNDDVETAQAAAFAMANIAGPAARPALPVLQEALRDGTDPQLQEQAAAALGRMEAEAAAAVPDLAKMLSSSPDPKVRRNCVLALGQMGAAAEPAMPQMINALKPETEKDIEVRRFTAEALFKMESPANDKAIPTVIELIRRDPEMKIRGTCIDVLFKVKDINNHGAAEVLTAVLNETAADKVGLRFKAARVLAFHLKEKVPDRVLPVLLEALKSPDFLLYRGANTQVGGVGEARTTQSSVNEMKGGDARFLYAMALGWVGPKANKKDITDALEQAAKDKDPELVRHAKLALKMIRGK